MVLFVEALVIGNPGDKVSRDDVPNSSAGNADKVARCGVADKHAAAAVATSYRSRRVGADVVADNSVAGRSPVDMHTGAAVTGDDVDRIRDQSTDGVARRVVIQDAIDRISVRRAVGQHADVIAINEVVRGRLASDHDAIDAVVDDVVRRGRATASDQIGLPESRMSIP